MTVGGVEISIPMLTEAKPDREIKNNVGVGPSLAGRRNDGPAERHQRLSLGADLEAEAQRLPFETGGDGQHDVGELRPRLDAGRSDGIAGVVGGMDQLSLAPE